MVGQRIKKYLLENGIKQSFLVEKTGISASIINAILNKNRRLEVVEYYEICKALNVPFDMFLEG